MVISVVGENITSTGVASGSSQNLVIITVDDAVNLDNGRNGSNGRTSTTVAQDTDEQDIRRAAKGDAGAFGRLYDRYVDRVYRYCYFRTRNRSDAEELTQQTFLLAWKGLPQYRIRNTPFGAWLLTIAHNVVLGIVRKHRLEIAEDHTEAEIAAEGDLEADVALRLEGEAVRQALDRLGLERQLVIVLRFIEGLTAEEIAGVLRKTPNNVRVIQHRALADLRRMLREEGRGG